MIDEASARRLFQTAIDKGKAAELLNCLFNGGSATVDPNGELVMVGADLIAQMAKGD